MRENLRHLKSKWLILQLLMIVTFTSCNKDVFVNKYAPDVLDYTVSGTLDTLTVKFKGGNWDIEYFYDSMMQISSSEAKSYDLNGVEQEQKEGILLKELGYVTYSHNGIEFSIRREKSDELTLIMGANSMLNNYILYIVVGNEYDIKSLKVIVENDDIYIVDRIEYPNLENAKIERNSTLVDKVTINNTGDKELTGRVVWKDNFEYTAVFNSSIPYMQDDSYSSTPISIPQVKDGKAIIQHLKCKFYSNLEQSIMIVHLNTEEKSNYTLQPHTQVEFCLNVQYITLSTEYILHLKSSKNGKEKLIRGIYNSSEPIGYTVTQNVIQ